MIPPCPYEKKAFQREQEDDVENILIVPVPGFLLDSAFSGVMSVETIPFDFSLLFFLANEAPPVARSHVIVDKSPGF